MSHVTQRLDGAEQPDGTLLLHGTAVAWRDRGCLILGPSGSGKSSLALELMAYGAELIGDDGILVEPRGAAGPMARAPVGLPTLIEARGIGLLPVALTGPTRLVLAVDLSRTELERLPQQRTACIGTHHLPILFASRSPAFAAMILQTLKSGGPS